MTKPLGTAATLALHASYIEKVNEALENGSDKFAIALAAEYAAELGLVRVA